MRTFFLETRTGLLIVTLLVLGLGMLLLYLAGSHGLGEYARIFDR